MVQAIGYVRRSTNRQEESLEQQRAKLQNFAQGAAGNSWRCTPMMPSAAARCTAPDSIPWLNMPNARRK